MESIIAFNRLRIFSRTHEVMINMEDLIN